MKPVFNPGLVVENKQTTITKIGPVPSIIVPVF